MKYAGSLLEGNITRQFLVLAAPLLIGNIFQQFYNTIDAVIIGRYVGQEAFAAIGIAGTVMNLFIFLLGGCCTGVSILLARLFGSGNKQAFRQESFMAFFFGTMFALLLSVVSILLLPYVLRLIQTPPKLFVPIRQSLAIVLGGLGYGVFPVRRSYWLWYLYEKKDARSGVPKGGSENRLEDAERNDSVCFDLRIAAI